jgi:hypothetical protein
VARRSVIPDPRVACHCEGATRRAPGRPIG